MKRAADAEAHRALGARSLGQFHRALHSGDLAGDDDLLPRVVIRGDDLANGAGLRGRSPLSAAAVRRGSRPSCPRAARPAAAISSPALPHEADGVLQRECAGRVIRGQFAERVAGGGAHVRRQPFPRDGPHRRAVCEQRRLRVVRPREFVGGALERERAELRAQRGVGAAPDVARGGESRLSVYDEMFRRADELASESSGGLF